jgi:polyvinyl alcohol dehydrogenase (cytochrome)
MRVPRALAVVARWLPTGRSAAGARAAGPIAVSLLAAVLSAEGASAVAAESTPGAVPDGATLYAQRCAGCHDAPAERTPAREALARLRADDIVRAVTQGIMRAHAEGLDAAQLGAIAAYLAGPAAATPTAPDACVARAPLDLAAPGWRGWGNDPRNPRFQPAPGLAAEDVPRLKPRWVFAFDASMTVGQPVVAGGRVYAGTHSGQVVSLDARTGCTHWIRRYGAPVRTAITLGPLPEGAKARVAAYFGDDRGMLRAVDAETGEELWSRLLDTHVAARITGAPLLHGGRLYVPVSSGEEGWAQSPAYACCTFRGSVMALDAVTGDTVWRTYTIDASAQPYRTPPAGARQLGPAGAAVWSAPTLDERRGLLYVGTGNSYTDVPETGSDAVFALDAQTGRVRWSQQLRPGDNYVMPCVRPAQAGSGNCPRSLGPDFDIGSSPVLGRLPDGRDVLLVGQKSGTLYALDPDRAGRRLWEVTLGAGSALGGIEWGFAIDGDSAYVPIADPFRHPHPGAGDPRPGVYAVRIADGAVRWQWAAPSAACAWGPARCLASMSAATTAMPGIVFAGGSDGHLRAYRSGDGQLVWDFDTAAAPHAAVNGGSARGGSIDNGGPVVAGGMVFVHAGYGRQLARSGNALFAFSVDGR